MNPLPGGPFIDGISKFLEFKGYKYLEIPTLIHADIIRSCLEGTENRAFFLGEHIALIPEVTNYIRRLGIRECGADKIYYVTKCFRNETNTGSERLCEFTQIGVEFLGTNELDCCRDVRALAIAVMQRFFETSESVRGNWYQLRNVKRGLNLYSDQLSVFEFYSTHTKKQLLGGGAYKYEPYPNTYYSGGAGWALGLERFLLARDYLITH